MENKSEITIEIRSDILNLLKTKAVKYGYDFKDLFNYIIIETVRTKKLPFDIDYHPELPPIVSSEELVERFEEIWNQLHTTDDIIYISHDSELSCVLMTEEKYDKLTAAVRPIEDSGNGWQEE